MKLKKFFAAAAACAVAAFSAAAYAVNTVNAATIVGKAVLLGQMGTYTQMTADQAVTNASTVANIDGNAQYEATWNITGTGAASIDFLALQISGADTTSADYANFSSTKYPNLSVSIDAVYVDGVQATYAASPASVDLKYNDNGKEASRIYLTSVTASPILCQDLSSLTAVKSQIKVVFTVSGLDTQGTSNVSIPAQPTTNANNTLLPTDNAIPTEAPTLAPPATQAVGGGAVLGNSTQTDSASTGDKGVAVAAAGLVATAGIGTIAVLLRKKK